MEKKANTAPDIIESFLTDDGEIMHILANGNQQTDVLYMKMWGMPKGKIITDKNYKGPNADRKHIFKN